MMQETRRRIEGARCSRYARRRRRPSSWRAAATRRRRGRADRRKKTPNGSYAISTINSAALPFAIASDTGGYKLEVMSGTITLSAGGTYSIVTNYRETLPGVSDTYTDSTGGTWAMTSGTSTVVLTGVAGQHAGPGDVDERSAHVR